MSDARKEIVERIVEREVIRWVLLPSSISLRICSFLPRFHYCLNLCWSTSSSRFLRNFVFVLFYFFCLILIFVFVSCTNKQYSLLFSSISRLYSSVSLCVILYTLHLWYSLFTLFLRNFLSFFHFFFPFLSFLPFILPSPLLPALLTYLLTYLIPFFPS